MNKYLKYSLKTIGVLFTLIILIFIGISIYVSINKKKLISEATEKISENIGGRIIIENMGVSMFENFTYVALTIKNVKITDSLYSKHRHALIQADKIFIRVNPIKLITLNIQVNKLTIKDGAFYIYTETSGYTNGYLLKGNGKA